MKTEIREISLENGKSIFVEVEITDDEIVPQQSNLPDDLPPGAEPTMSPAEIISSIIYLQNNIEGIAAAVHESLANLQPDEWSVEMNIGFKGKVTPIPFIAKAEAEGGLKVTAKWNKES